MLRKRTYVTMSTLLLGSTLAAQSFFSKEIKGQIVNANTDLADVHVLNTTSHTATITDAQGYFTIAVKLNDTLVFSGVQYVKKEIVISKDMYNSNLVQVPLEEFTNELNEVTVMPYNLSGDLASDMGRLEKEPLYTASTIGLPNANVKLLTKNERLLREASMGPVSIGLLFSVPFNPIVNAITGRTKRLKKIVAAEQAYRQTDRVQNMYVDSLFVNQLGIPKEKIDDFMYFCEVDESFNALAKSNDELKLWEFLQKKSKVYRENNGLKEEE